MLNPKIISENIIFLRQQQNMTQQELAARVNVTHQAVSKWENGSSIPDLQTLMTLSRLFNVTLDELLTEVLSERRAAPQADAPADEPVAEQPAAPVEPITPVEPVAPVGQPAAAPIDMKVLVKMAPLMGRSELGRAVLSVDPAALDRQLTASGCDNRRELPYHKALLAGELPLTIGGGIGQSRLSMLLLGKAHIGEVQASIWDAETVEKCEKAGVVLL